MTELQVKLLAHQVLLFLEDLQRYDSLAKFLLPPISRERMVNSFLEYKKFMDEITETEEQFRVLQ